MNAVRTMFRTLAAGFAPAPFMAIPAQAGNLNVTIERVRSNAGALMIGLYDSPERFRNAITNSAHIGLLSDKGRMIGVTMRARTGSDGIGFLQLPPGRYALIVFHDENDNGLLDENIFGVPKEGYAFSNNATGFLSAPSFDAAAIAVGSGDQNVSVSLTYQIAPPPRPRLAK